MLTWRKITEAAKGKKFWVGGGISEKAAKKAERWLRWELIKLAVGRKILGYAPVEGADGLREEVARYYGIWKDQVLIVNGGQQGLTLALKTVGGKVAVERYSYYGLKNWARVNKKKLTVWKGQWGETEGLEDWLREEKVNVMYVMSDIANPTGISLTLVERKKMAKIADKLGIWVIEDGAYRQWNRRKVRTIFEIGEKVLHLGSVTKMGLPGVRVGWILVKSNKMFQQLDQQKEAEDLSSSAIDQKIAKDWLKLAGMKRMFVNVGEQWRWVDTGRDSQTVWREYLKKGIGLAPGEIFEMEDKKSNYVRIAYNGESSRIIAELGSR